MDALNKALYGSKTKSTADISRAIDLARNDLLHGKFDITEITALTTELRNGPVPYSTHDLATSVALGLLRRVPIGRRKGLEEVQIMARLTVATWAKEGLVVPALALAFENTLYRDYHPNNLSERTTFAEDHLIDTASDSVIQRNISRLIQNAFSDRSVDPREIAQPNCAVVLSSSGQVFLRWLSLDDNDMDKDIVSFALLGRLSSFGKLLQTCAQEAKTGTLNDAFFYGPGDMLFYSVAIEAVNEMKRFLNQIKVQRRSANT